MKSEYVEICNKKLFKNSVQKCFFIDYENVKESGLRGIAELDKHVAVIIFYSKRAYKIPLDIASVFSESKAKLIHIKVDVGTKNALDFQLVSFLGYVIARHRELGIESKYFMVTNDGGFDCVKHFWSQHGVKIHRVSQIERDPEIIDDKQSSNVDKKQEQTQAEQISKQNKEIETLQEKVQAQAATLRELLNSSSNNGSQVVKTVSENNYDIEKNNVTAKKDNATAKKDNATAKKDNATAKKNELKAKMRAYVLESKDEKILSRVDAITNLIISCKSKAELHTKLQKTYSKKVGSPCIGAFYREIKKYLPY